MRHGQRAALNLQRKRDLVKNRVRLEDIAVKAGLSKMAVSLALRDDPSIRPETSKRVKKIADSLGYLPNLIAKGLVNGRSYTLAAIIGGSLHDDYHNQFLKGAIDYSMKRGYALSIALTDIDAAIEANMIQRMRQMMVDGILAFHSNCSRNYQRLQELGVPFVFYTKYFPDLESDYVVCDDLKGGYMMTKHLLSLGHTRIAFVHDGITANRTEVANRLQGYKKALLEAVIEPTDDLILPFCYTYKNPRAFHRNAELVERLRTNTTAFFVCNDFVTSAFYIFLKSMGYKIPEDVSVGGYEGVYLGHVLDPPLTTVVSPIVEMGQEAAKTLIDKIEGNIPSDQKTQLSLEPVLSIRGSTSRRQPNNVDR